MIEFLILVLAGIMIAGAVSLVKLRRRVTVLETTVRNLRHLPSATDAPQSGTYPAASERVPGGIAGAQPPEPATLPPAVTRPPIVAQAAPGPEPFKKALPGPTPSPPSPFTADGLASFERLIGTRWLNWVGALVTLVGTAFLLKFLYDRGWIGPSGRVAIGMGIGAGLLYLGEFRLRRFHDLFSQSVSAAGCGALFLAAFLSFKFYEFSGRTATFGLLCWLAVFTVALAVVRRGQILAYLGLLGAYLTPYLLSTGQDQAEGLFAYLAVLALAAAGVQAARNWPGIASLCLGFTWIYYVGWFSRFYSQDRLLIATVGAGGMILFIGGGALYRGVYVRKPVGTEESVVLTAASILGTYHLWNVLNERHAQALGFVLCGIALALLAALRAARRRQASTAVLEAAILGLSTGSLLLVIPACLRADGAMLAWALGALVLADIGVRSGQVLIEIAAGVCLVAGPWVGLDQNVVHTGIFVPIVNRVFLAWLWVVLVWFFVGRRYFGAFPEQSVRRVVGLALQVATSFMLLALFTVEAYSWFDGQIGFPNADAPALRDWRTVVLSLIWAGFPLIWVRWASRQRKLLTLSTAHYAVLGLAFMGLLAVFHHRESIPFLNPVFPAALSFPAGVFLLSRKIEEANSKLRYSLQIYAHLLCVILISVELYQGLYLNTWPASSLHWIRMALISAAWAIYATALLGAGIARNLQAWRWLALGLLGAALLKVIFLDMAEVRQIWRVVSFMVLGALLMVCSYAYSRNERMKRHPKAVNEADKEVNR